MGLLKALRIRIMNFMIFFLIVVLLPGLPPRTTFPYKEFVVAPPKELKGALEPNFHLEGAERLLEGRIAGPECLLVRNNEIYTGIHGGEIIKLTSNHITHVAKFGQPCMDKFEEAQCGRPLGMAFDTQGNNLLVADAYYGLWQVDLTTHKKKLLVSPDQELPGKEIARRAKTFNSVAVNKEGDIFYTDSSSDFSIQDLIYASFANPSGRLFKYNRAKNVSEVLLDEVFFANGLALNPTEDFIVMAETGAMRLTKYHLKGPKAGQSEVFVDGLPGMPDNLTPDAEGLWVPIVSSADSDHPSTFSLFSRFPTIRLFLARILALFELPFHFFNSVYPNKFSQRFTHFVGHGEMALLLAPRRASVLRVDWNGNIVGSLHGFDKSVAGISHVLEFQDHLYLGSPFNHYLGRVKSPKAAKQPTIKVRNVRVEGEGLEASVGAPPPTTTTAKPKAAPIPTTTTTTTTPKPQTASTTTKKPTTTTTARPTTTKTTTTTIKPATVKTTTAKPTTTTTKRTVPTKPAPVEEVIPVDTKPPQKEKLKIINREGSHVEL